MKIVICSDSHCDKRTSGVDRFDDVAQALHQTVDAAVAEKADAWAFLGDWANPDDGTTVIRATCLLMEIATRLKSAEIKSFFVMGNHDPEEGGVVLSTLSPLRFMGPWVRVAERPMGEVVKPHDVAVVCLPYSPISWPYDIADATRKMVAGIAEQGGARTGVVLAHATQLDGVKQGEETLEMPRGRAVRLPIEEIPEGWRVFCGHWHTPQVTQSGVVVPGSLSRLTFGETHDPRFLIVEV